MSEAEYIVWESLFSPGKKKRKKKVKPSSIEMLTQKPKDHTPKKKKKNAKFKKVMDEKKAKRKDKKRKKKEKLSKLNDCVDESQCFEPLTSEHTAKDTKKKRKKQVAFNLPHNYERVKRPKFSSSPQQCADCSSSNVSTVEEATAVVEPSQIQPKASDSQSTSDDMQSQDLFITQKTFRLPLSEMSSEEASDRTEDNAKVMEVYFRETQEECVLFKTQKIKKEKVKSSSSHPFLEEPIVVTSSPDANKITKDCSGISQLSHSDRQPKTFTSVYTQTENFFTTELSLYLHFCKKSTRKAQSDEPAPLDLSLPHRARYDLSTSTKDTHEETKEKDIIEVCDEGSGQLSSCGLGKDERTPSPPSESDNKSGDTTVSSEDADVPNRTTRLELMRIRAVQMKLNESFYFKTKGERPSPRPESPLMKLVQGRELRSHTKN